MNGTRSLTIGERIVVHLSQYARSADAFVCPREVSQAGIATCLGITRAHAAIELKRQMEAGRIAVKTAHVAGEPTRRKVYRLTPKGDARAESVRVRAFARRTILVQLDGTEATVSGLAAFQGLRSIRVPEGYAILMLLTRPRIDLRYAGLRSPLFVPRRRIARSPEAEALDAFRRRFQRPVAWHLEVVLGPPHAPPVPAAA